MPLVIAVLKTELDTDPRSYGYAASRSAGDAVATAEALNLVRTGANGGPAITIRRADILASELLEAIDGRDFVTTLTAIQSAWFESATQATVIRLIDDAGADTRMLGNFERSLVAAGQGSRTRLRALAVRNGSRAEELFGRDTFVSVNDVSSAWTA